MRNAQFTSRTNLHNSSMQLECEYEGRYPEVPLARTWLTHSSKTANHETASHTGSDPDSLLHQTEGSSYHAFIHLATTPPECFHQSCKHSGNHRVVVVGGVAYRDVPTNAANCCPHHHPCLSFRSSATLQEQSSHTEHFTLELKNPFQTCLSLLATAWCLHSRNLTTVHTVVPHACTALTLEPSARDKHTSL